MTMSAQRKTAFYDVKEGKEAMKYALNVLQMLGENDEVIVRGSDQAISNAVTVANIVTTRLLKGNTVARDIIVDSETPKRLGRMVSTIRITVAKV